MNVLSLFSGIGGLDLGLQRAGMTIAGQVEIDPWCRTILAKHWPEVPRHDDVRTCAEWWGDRPVDLVCGGFPCQPVSLAGARQGQADSRWLWPSFAATVRHLRPRYVLVENTPGLTSLGMGDVVGDLAALGYDAEWDCIPACWVGAPHIRERIFLVAYPGNRAEPERPRQARREAGERSPIRHVARDDGQDVAHAESYLRRAPGHDRPPASDGSGPILADTASARLAPGQPGESRPVRHQARRPQPERRSGHAADADREPLGWPAEPRCERGHWTAEPAVGRVAHGIPRRVDRLRGLGNAVVPQVAEHIGRLIMEAA